MRDWFRFFRIQTAAITFPSVLIGYLLAGGNLLSIGALEWILFGIIFHVAGFAQNNLEDFNFDTKDRNKDLFPLGRTMTLRQGQYGTLVLHLIGIVYAILLIHNLIFFFLFGMMYAFGLLYNRTSKSSIFAGVWIGFCFGPLPFLSYLSTTGSYSPLILAVTSYGVLQTFFQNGLSGSMKDIEEDKYNPLKALKVRVEDGRLVVPAAAWYFVNGVKWAAFIPLVFVWRISGITIDILSFVLFMVMIFFMTKLFLPGQKYDHKLQIRRIVLVEILTFYAMVVALTPVISYGAVLFVIVVSFGWFLAWNRLLWGSAISPRV